MYEQNLWNNFETLHNKYKHRYDCTNHLIQMLNSMITASKNYSKDLKSIYGKNLAIADNPLSSEGKALDSIRLNFSVQGDEFNEMGEQLKNKVLNVCKKTIDSTYTKEKEKYSELKKSIAKFNEQVAYMEKTRQKFETSAKGAERAIISAKKMKFSVAEQLLKEAQDKEKIYKTNLELANKLRLDSIEKQKSILEMYQQFDNDFSANTKDALCFYVAAIKKMLSSVLSDLDSIFDKLKEINTNKDIEDFVLQNKTNESPTPELPFIAYKPDTTLNDNLGHPELPFEIISELKIGLSNVLPEFNLELEQKRSTIRKLSFKVFTSNKDFIFSPEEKNQLIEYVKEKESRMIFLHTLNKQRTSGKFQRSERLMNNLEEIVKEILDISEKENDYESAKNCIILSQTFYIEEKGKKRYLFESIMNNAWLISPEFWEGVIEQMIQDEIEKNHLVDYVKSGETNEENEKRISNIAFSQVLPYSNNMLDFRMDRDVVLGVVMKFIEKYKIDKDLAEPIISNVKERPY